MSHHHSDESVFMGDESIISILKNIGFTAKEAEIYLFLSKYGLQKGLEIARHTKTHKALVYRIIKSLQSKGMVEATLESPTRFIATPFEKVLDTSIKQKREEVDAIEKAKKEVLAEWGRIGRPKLDALERFVVVRGNRGIYAKMIEMTKNTESKIASLSSISGLAHAEQHGLFDVIFNHPLKDKIQSRFLLTSEHSNLKALRSLVEGIPSAGMNFQMRDYYLGLKSSPKMFIRDNDELMFFISPRDDENNLEKEATCVWTNCKTLVRSFIDTFEELWRNSTDINSRICNENILPLPESSVLGGQAREEYEKDFLACEKEIIAITSSDCVGEFLRRRQELQGLVRKGLCVKLMMPISSETLSAVQELSTLCEIRHVPDGYAQIVVIDGSHFFNLREPISFVDDIAFVQGARAKLIELWENASPSSTVTLESILQPKLATDNDFLLAKSDPYGAYLKGVGQLENQIVGKITEKEILDKIISAKRIYANDPQKDINTLYGSNAGAVIHMPASFGLPDMMVSFWHCNKQSSWGAEDYMTVRLWLETPKGFRYVPVAHVTDNPLSLEFRKGVFKGTPASQNCQLIDKDQFEVSVQGNTLFAGWSIPIKLFPPNFTLPPACILFEGHGKLVSGISEMHSPAGRKQVMEFNRLAALVTFYHPASKYSGPGAEGILDRDAILTAYPPSP